MVYLDHNATTDIHPAVKDKMMEFYNRPLNPSSIHTYGREGKKILEQSRKQLAQLLGIENHFKDYQITFTSSGTEANNLILSNFLDGEIFISKIEHPSILAHKKVFSDIKLIDVNENGLINLDNLKAILSTSNTKKKLVSVMIANNETGIIQPLKEIREIAHNFGALIHSDCVQAPGKINLDLSDLNIDFASISAHKFGGPVGAGAMIAKTKYHLNPMIIGGGQEKNLRSGTENVIAIAGFGTAAEIAKQELLKRYKHMLGMRTKLESALLLNFPNVKIAGVTVDRLPNTSLIINAGKKAEIQVIAFDLKGIALSSGAACSSGKVGSSTVLKAMGYSELDTKSAIRVSIGTSTTENDIDKFLKIYSEINT